MDQNSNDQKPELSLVSGKDLDDETVLVALFKKLMGREPTEEELKEARENSE